MSAKKGKTKTTKRTVVVGSATTTLSGGQSASVEVALNRAGKQLLSSRHTLAVKLSANADGSALAAQTVTFKAPSKKKHH